VPRARRCASVTVDQPLPDPNTLQPTTPPQPDDPTNLGWLAVTARLVLLVYLVYSDIHGLVDTESWNVFAGLTLAIHESGHLLFAAFGHWLMVAGGSLTQVLAPVTVAVLFLRRADRYGVAIVGTWITYSLTNLAEYVGDARAMALQLVGFSDDPIHDWHYLLDSVNLLAYDTRLALLVRDLAWLVLLTSVVLGALELRRQARAQLASTATVPADPAPRA
jgi:hypothetical protein